jgi:hypothetical protein
VGLLALSALALSDCRQCSTAILYLWRLFASSFGGRAQLRVPSHCHDLLTTIVQLASEYRGSSIRGISCRPPEAIWPVGISKSGQSKHTHRHNRRLTLLGSKSHITRPTNTYQQDNVAHACVTLARKRYSLCAISIK